MSEKLNRLDADGIRRLQEFFAEELSSAKTETTFWQCHLNLGCIANAPPRDPGLIHKHLSAAAEHGIRRLANRKAPRPNVHRQPMSYELPLMLTACFGNHELRASLIQIPRESWFHPEDPGFAPCADAYALFAQYVATSSVELAEIDRVTESNRHSFDALVPWNRTLLTALRALVECNPDDLQTSVDSLLMLHRREALSGDWQKVPEGLVATQALAVVVLAREAGIEWEIASPYLPFDALR